MQSTACGREPLRLKEVYFLTPHPGDQPIQVRAWQTGLPTGTRHPALTVDKWLPKIPVVPLLLTGWGSPSHGWSGQSRAHDGARRSCQRSEKLREAMSESGSASSGSQDLRLRDSMGLTP